MNRPSISRGATSPRTSRIQTDESVVTHSVETVRALLDLSIFNHTLRVLHLARHLATAESFADHEALAVAALWHDSGTAEPNNGQQRFELEGADAASRFLGDWGWSGTRIRPVWEAIALHTSPGIAERFGPLARLLRTAVLVDLRRTPLPVATSQELDDELTALPRLDIDRALPVRVITQALQSGRTEKAPPYSWPGALVAEYRAGHRAHASMPTGFQDLPTKGTDHG